MNTSYDAILDCTPYGIDLAVGIVLDNASVVSIDFLDPQKVPSFENHAGLAALVVDQLNDYFQGKRVCFDLPVSAVGTAFQQRVWQAMCQIPYGETHSYGELAKLLNSSPRAVGGACRANPVPIIIPCHRVVAAHDIGGFAGDRVGGRVATKAWLLSHEQN